MHKLRTLRKQDTVKHLEKEIADGYKDFANEVAIPGFRETITASHWTISLLWITLIITGIILTGFFIFKVVNEYMDAPTATKMRKVRLKKYEFPPILICLEDSKMPERLFQAGFTESAGKYLYSLTGSLENSYSLSVAEYLAGKADFEKQAENLNLTFFEEAFTLGAINVFDLSLFCDGCESVQLLYSTVINRLCIKITLPDVPSSKIPESLNSVSLELAKNSSKYIWFQAGKEYPDFDIDDLVPVKTGTKYVVRISASREISYRRADNPCVENAKEKSYSEASCNGKCKAENYLADGYNCRELLPFDQIIDKTRNFDICSMAHGFMNKNINLSAPYDEPEPLDILEMLNNISIQCLEKCLHPCDFTTYDFEFFELPDEEKNALEIEMSFKLAYATTGILVYEETPTYTFESAISNIGGQLGLWLGLSIVSIFQLVLYFINICLIRCKPKRVKANK